MQLMFSVVGLVVAGPAAASTVHGIAAIGSGMPDATVVALVFAGFGLVSGARRGRSNALAD